MAIIACLGWGSLVWRKEDLKIEPPWKEDGPAVQVEFLRQSTDDSITLVLDESAAPVPSLWAWMTLTELDIAAEDLRVRERIPPEYPNHIGRWSIGQPAPLLIKDLPCWAHENGVDAVIWTALGRKFHGSRKEPAPVAAVIGHLDQLPEKKRKLAEEYVRYAPRQVDTGYRRAIADALGWTMLDYPG